MQTRLPSTPSFWLRPCLMLLGALVSPLGALTLHVDPAATGSGDGSSWTDAFTDLQSALATATSGDEVWLAAGTYYPDAGANQVADDRASTFSPPDGIALYGGFSGNEQVREDRNPAIHSTILSGDLLQNNTTSGSTLDDAYHVITINGAGSSTILDGLTVTAGNASGAMPDNAGGGLLCIGGASATVRNCSFAGNLASDLGGAIHIDGGSSPSFTSCSFAGNQTSYLGGAVCITNSSAPTFANCTFAENAAPGLSGYGGAIYTSPSSTVELFNSILWDNSATTTGDQFTGPLAPASGENLVDGATPGGAIVSNADPLFIANPDPGPDGLWTGPADNNYGNLDLQAASPAKDLGENAHLSNTLDLAHRSRLQNGAVDLGAYEIPLVLTVSSLDDWGFGTLRDLVSDLPSPGGATIQFSPALDGQTILLTGGPLNLDRHVEIDGSALVHGITIDAGQASRVAEVAVDRTVVLKTLTLTGGRSADGIAGAAGSDNPGSLGGSGEDGTPGEDGGAIINRGSLTLDRVTLSGNTTGAGGAGGNGGSGSTTGSAGSGARSGRGGAIANEGTLVLINTTLAGNTTGPGGNAGSGTGSPLGGTGGDGGGILNTGTLTILHGTITNNSVGPAGSGATPPHGTGGGLKQMGQLTLSNSVISENSAPAGGPDLDGAADAVAGLNFVGNPTGASGLGPALLSGPSLLDPLTDNGGPTMTCRPSSDSPLVDPVGGDTTSRLATDQRGLARITTGVVDIGAVEAFLSALVTNTADSGDGSLRNSIEALEPGGVITFDTNLDGAAISLTTGTLELIKAVRIDASTLPAGITIDGGNASRVFTIHDGDDGFFSEVTLTKLTVTNGSTIGNGGAISNREHLTLSDCSFLSNSTSGSGGALWLAMGTSSIERCTLVGNSSGGSGGGGAVRLEAPAILNATDSQFTGNTTTDTSPSSRGGGAVSTAAGSSLSMDSCLLDGNSSDSLGGALSVQSGQPTLDDIVFSRNSAQDGGAIHLLSGAPDLLRCHFVENSAGLRGGAVSMTSGATPSIINSTFHGNASADGGASHHNNSSPHYINCAFSGNHATTGGAIHNASNSAPAFTNCTITANSAEDGGGLFSVLSTPILTHTILWSNSASVSDPNLAGPVDGSSSLNLIEGGSGPHVISTADPRFALPPDPGADGDWSGFADNIYGNLGLLPGSPAIDAGSNATYDALTSVATDLSRKPRQDGAIDLGPFEGVYTTFAVFYPLLDPWADENGNGVNNFVEYASGADPTAPLNPSPLTLLTIDQLITFVRSGDPADTDPKLQFSHDLLTWTTMIEGVDYTIAASSTSGFQTQRTLQLLNPPGSSRFFRVDFEASN